jgi:hypothetical protein
VLARFAPSASLRSPNPRPLVLGHYVPSASPLELQGVAGRIPLQAGRLKPLGHPSEILPAVKQFQL